jgi:hypothetical protein
MICLACCLGHKRDHIFHMTLQEEELMYRATFQSIDIHPSHISFFHNCGPQQVERLRLNIWMVCSQPRFSRNISVLPQLTRVTESYFIKAGTSRDFLDSEIRPFNTDLSTKKKGRKVETFPLIRQRNRKHLRGNFGVHATKYLNVM